MNASRFRKRAHSHAAPDVDWTGKRRVSLTVLIALDSIVTPAHRQVVQDVEGWATAMKCGITAFDNTSTRLVLGSGVTHRDKADTLTVARYAARCASILTGSGLRWAIRHVAPIHFLPHHDENPVPDLDVDRLHDPAYRESMRPAMEQWEAGQAAYQQRLQSYGAGNNE